MSSRRQRLLHQNGKNRARPRREPSEGRRPSRTEDFHLGDNGLPQRRNKTPGVFKTNRGVEKERERETDRQTDRDTDIDRDTERDRVRERESAKERSANRYRNRKID